MKKLIIVWTATALLFSCTKYEEGPDFSLRSKKERVSNNWVVSTATVNDADSTIAFFDAYRNYQLNIGSDKQYSLSYKPYGIGNYTEIGAWDFNSDKTHILFTNPSGETIDYTILRLQQNDLRLQFMSENGNQWKLHLVPKAIN